MDRQERGPPATNVRQNSSAEPLPRSQSATRISSRLAGARLSAVIAARRAGSPSRAVAGLPRAERYLARGAREQACPREAGSGAAAANFEGDMAVTLARRRLVQPPWGRRRRVQLMEKF